jgi:bifunctional enzyme CysN/CysC
VADERKRLLRFLAAGSVDDGKSTLIGRLLYDSGGVYEDQLASVQQASEKKGRSLDFSLITDGLKAEREQSITIDVAYRYFATQRRKFIVADVPGHAHYTRNMVTGASTADVAVILIDVRKGVLEQTRRHTYIAWLLGIRRIIVAVNKMDIVGFAQSGFTKVCDDYRHLTAALDQLETHFIPLCALTGENVASRSDRMPWYEGPSLLDAIETISVEGTQAFTGFRFVVQSVIHPDQDYRGYAGRVVAGMARKNMEVIAIPSQQRTTISHLSLYTQELDQVQASQSVVLTTDEHLALGRGDMLSSPDNLPVATKHVTANLIWMARTPLRLHAPYLVKHATQSLSGSVSRLLHKIDIETFENIPSETLLVNEIGLVQLETHKPMLCDRYSQNRTTGSFILIDPDDNDTVAAGLIVETTLQPSDCEAAQVDKAVARHQGLTVWLTGLSGAGKSTIAQGVCTELLVRGMRVQVLDADALRKDLNRDLGFSKEDRDENIRRIGFVADLLTRQGVVVLVAAISPYRAARESVRQKIGDFIEVHVNAPLPICEERDPKGLYKKARAGMIPNFTGIDAPYEEPLAPDILLNTHRQTLKSSVNAVLEMILSRMEQS